VNDHQRREHRQRHERPNNRYGALRQRQVHHHQRGTDRGQLRVPQPAVPFLAERDIHAAFVQQSGISLAGFAHV